MGSRNDHIFQKIKAATCLLCTTSACADQSMLSKSGASTQIAAAIAAAMTSIGNQAIPMTDRIFRNTKLYVLPIVSSNRILLMVAPCCAAILEDCAVAVIRARARQTAQFDPRVPQSLRDTLSAARLVSVV